MNHYCFYPQYKVPKIVFRHSRESGNPEIEAAHLDSRLRGNDEADGKNADQEGFL